MKQFTNEAFDQAAASRWGSFSAPLRADTAAPDARLANYHIAAFDAPVRQRIKQILGPHLNHISEQTVQRFCEISGDVLGEQEKAMLIEQGTANLRRFYSPSDDHEWIKEAEIYALEVCQTLKSLEGYLGAQGQRTSLEQKLLFESSSSREDANELITQHARISILEIEILFKAMREYQRQSRMRWIKSRTVKFQKWIAERVAAAAKQSASSEARADVASNNSRELLERTDHLLIASGQSVAGLDELREVAKQMHRQMQTATKGLEDASRQMAGSSTIAEESFRDVNILTQKGNALQSTVKLLQSVTTQTNVLALNARIEAAAAGEAGVPFSVVASEIKGLSDQAAQASGQIVGHLAAIDDASRAAVESNRAMRNFFEEVHGTTMRVCAAMAEQMGSVTEVSQRIGETAVDAAKTREALGELREAIDELSRELKLATNSSRKLRGFLSGLQDPTSDFIDDLAEREANAVKR
jgi:methyl-accepting chemotaxis protein